MLSFDWAFYLTNVGGPVDVTDRCLGFTVEQITPIGQMGRGDARIEIRNDDGAFTPKAGGTYSSTDWFAYYLEVECTVTNATANSQTAVLFNGPITGFDLRDDGVNSTVVISAMDMLSAVGASIPENVNVAKMSAPDIHLMIERLYNGLDLWPGVPLNRFSGLPMTLQTQYTRNPGVSATLMFTDGTGNLSAMELLNNSFMPGGPFVAYPTIIDSDTQTTDVAVVDWSMLKSESGTNGNERVTFNLYETSGQIATSIPYSGLQRGFNNSEMANVAVLTSVFGPTTYRVTDSASIAKYGPKSVQFNEIKVGLDATFTQAPAERWANRNSTPDFVTLEVATSEATIAAFANDAAYDEVADLLDIRTGMWNLAEVVFTPAGTSTRLGDNCIIASRSIGGTPGRVRIKLGMLPENNNVAFVLDSSSLGRLSENRLG
jgi:hypothetical protein